MKKLKYIFLFIIAAAMFTSCFKDETPLDLNDDGANVIAFLSARANVSNISDGNEYTFDLKMHISGPTITEVTSDLAVTYAATSASTAIEGVHYRLDNSSLTLTKANNYLGSTTVVMLTDGIIAPLDESPILYLQPSVVTGDGSVLPSGKPIKVTLNYACFSNLAGSYTSTTLRDGDPISVYTDIEITETGTGEYRTSKVGHWFDLGVGTPGFTFYDVCNVITIPEQLLVDYYGNVVLGVAGMSSVNPDTGVITVVYTITSSWQSEYKTVYTPV